jgi:hypothetical protein
MEQEAIQEGYDVFVHDGDKAFGAVRQVAPQGRREIVIYVENAGDFTVPYAAIKDVEAEKVVLNCAKLDIGLRRAIGHAHDDEDPRIP